MKKTDIPVLDRKALDQSLAKHLTHFFQNRGINTNDVSTDDMKKQMFDNHDDLLHFTEYLLGKLTILEIRQEKIVSILDDIDQPNNEKDA